MALLSLCSLPLQPSNPSFAERRRMLDNGNLSTDAASPPSSGASPPGTPSGGGGGTGADDGEAHLSGKVRVTANA